MQPQQQREQMVITNDSLFVFPYQISTGILTYRLQLYLICQLKYDFKEITIKARFYEQIRSYFPLWTMVCTQSLKVIEIFFYEIRFLKVFEKKDKVLENP